MYRARDRRLGREVAVKLIHAHLRENTEVAARFVSEARAVARLRHPNVVEVFDVSDENEPERYLVVELVRGTTLRALLTQHKALSAELTAAIGLEVASALSHAHAQGIVHRDVKPENVLIDLTAAGSGPTDHPAGAVRVKLTDFGIAKLLDAQGVTSTGQVLGSPAHMAPEQIEGGDVGPRADVFALGVMLYECMVGRLPFDGKNPAQVLRRVLEGSYPPAARENPRVGSRYGDVLAKALERDAADRYESIEAFAEALRTELERVGIKDPHREIERFLGDPAGYAKAVEPELVEGLVASGERARAEGDVPLAAAQFNRALAYRPGDPELVRRATRLARNARLVTLLKYGSAAAVCAVAVTGGVAWLRGGRTPVPLPVQSIVRSLEKAAAAPSAASRAALPAPSAAVEEKQHGKLAVSRRPPTIQALPPRATKPAATRNVRIDLDGPKGGYLMLDGVREDNWYKSTGIEVSVGSHVFEFVPLEPDCCKPPVPVTHVVPEGEGSDHVSLRLELKDARLVVDVAPSGLLRCPTFFAGDFQVPGRKSIPMSRLNAAGPCTLTPSAGGSPITKEVSLTAGQNAEIPWP